MYELKMDYKPTLNLPKTNFSMKAELPKREPLFLNEWQEKDIYGLMRKNSAGLPKYILHDGPPYANGDIHIGHALNKTLKDIIIKYKTMSGFDSAYVPGWDCHGLPIEHQLFKELKINKHQISQSEFRKKAHEYALKFVSKQKEQFKRLGIFGYWDNPYLTLTPDYEESILRVFNTLVKAGYIYRGLKPVNWCFRCETALAEAEVEYENHTSASIYVKFKITGNKDLSDAALVIWTTTPWTLLANVAVALHPDLSYAYVKTPKGNLIIAKDLLEYALGQMGISDHKVIKEFKGKELEGINYEHPFIKRSGRVVLADYVSREDGTGLVHTAPGHGNEDYLTGIKYKLDIIMPVDNKGNFDSSTGEFAGMNCLAANKLILEKLDSLGALLFNSHIEHSYPHCWRCKQPIIFRATKQWFLNLEHKGLRKKLVEVIKKDVRWIPQSGMERILGMVGLRPDWCLSRQRYWGVPIPALVCNDCHEEFLVPGLIDNFMKFVAQEGSDSWFIRDLKDFMPEGLTCPHCKSGNLAKGADILDVWFDSGISAQGVLKKRKELKFPASLYLEGSDQHRGWFQSSLIPSVCIDNKAPFENVLTHGFVVDGEGRKMSKSQGNVISPFDIIEDYGADILRLWVASSDYNEDIRISKEMLSRLSEAYRKIRNTAKFILSNLYDFNPDKDRVAIKDFKCIDKWIISRLENVKKQVSVSYDAFEFHKAYKAIYDFCNEDLSMAYLDMVKGRLYTAGKHSVERRSAQTAIYDILNTLALLMAPILVFTAEDIWKEMPKPAGNNASSIHLTRWPSLLSKDTGFSAQDEQAANLIYGAMAIIPDITKLLEEKRAAGLIGSSFDAKIKLLTNNEERYKFLESLKDDLLEIFKVSQLDLEKTAGLDSSLNKSSANPDIAIEVFKAEGVKCPRCWNYSLTIGKSTKHPLVCAKCECAIGEEKTN